MTDSPHHQRYSLEDLLYLMRRLRDPEFGCPWDLKQSFQSIVPSTLEECYELADAIESEDYAHVREELGDVLFQVIFYSQLGREQQLFDFSDVVHGLVDKLLRRHPHVFANGDLHTQAEQSLDEKAIKANWEAIKASERQQKDRPGLLDDVPIALPALVRAAKLQKRAASVGFDWQDARGVITKLREELGELEEALGEDDVDAIEDEFGDLLFCVVNLSRHIKKDAETALRRANRKFESRFRYIEQRLGERGVSLQAADLMLMDELWEEAKSVLRDNSLA